MEKLAERIGYGDGDGLRAAYFPRCRLGALSSMANIAGYRAIVEAARNLSASLPANHCRQESAAGEGDGDWRGRSQSCGYRRGKQLGAIVARLTLVLKSKGNAGQSMGLSSSNWIF